MEREKFVASNDLFDRRGVLKQISIEEIAQGVNECIKTSGLKFKMDELAEVLSISKRTLYKKITGKEEVLRQLIDLNRQSIKVQQQEILADIEKTAFEKLEGLLTVMPMHHHLFDSAFVHQLKMDFPKLFDYVKNLYEDDWDITYELMDRCFEEGSIGIVDKVLFKHMYIQSLTFSNEVSMPYQERIMNITNILLRGIKTV